MCSKHADKEVAYQESRQRWTKPHNSKRYKDYDRMRSKDPFKTVQHKFYQSKQWRSIRESALRRDSHLCQYCLNYNRVRTGKIGDHIVPYEVEPDNRTNLTNIATCCNKYHTAKTKWEQLCYGTGWGYKLKRAIPIRNVKDLPDFQKNI